MANRPTIEEVHVYVDGSCINNGKPEARAGWGVWWQDRDLKHLNRAGRLAGGKQTNNRAELWAMIEAIRAFPDDGRQLMIWTDSMYGVRAIKQWLPYWERYGFRTVHGQSVKNSDLITLLEHELRQCYIRPEFIVIPGHVNYLGNEKADRMAKHGTTLPRPERYYYCNRSISL